MPIADFFVILVGVLLGAFGGVMMKIGAAEIEFTGFNLDTFTSIFFNWKIVLSLILYFIPALLWMYLLKKHPISMVQPLLSLTYVVTPILAFFFTREGVPLARWGGIGVIIIGVIIVSRS